MNSILQVLGEQSQVPDLSFPANSADFRSERREQSAKKAILDDLCNLVL